LASNVDGAIKKKINLNVESITNGVTIVRNVTEKLQREVINNQTEISNTMEKFENIVG
jgi:hypothetical protein